MRDYVKYIFLFLLILVFNVRGQEVKHLNKNFTTIEDQLYKWTHDKDKTLYYSLFKERIPDKDKTLYYSLFKESIPQLSLTKDDFKQRKEALLKTFELVKELHPQKDITTKQIVFYGDMLGEENVKELFDDNLNHIKTPETEISSRFHPVHTILIGSKWVARHNSNAAYAFWLGHELTHLIFQYEVPANLKEYLKKKFEDSPENIFITYFQLPVEIPLQDLRKKLNTGGGSMGYGFGTENIPRTVESIKAGINIEWIIKEYKNLLPRNIGGKLEHYFRNLLLLKQLEEIADMYGIVTASTFIKTYYKDDTIEQKKAALEILKSFPPMLYEEVVEIFMNSIGSKPVNEKRVFDVLFKCNEFRKLLGLKPIPQEDSLEKLLEATPQSSE